MDQYNHLDLEWQQYFTINIQQGNTIISFTSAIIRAERTVVNETTWVVAIKITVRVVVNVVASVVHRSSSTWNPVASAVALTFDSITEYQQEDGNNQQLLEDNQDIEWDWNTLRKQFTHVWTDEESWWLVTVRHDEQMDKKAPRPVGFIYFLKLEVE